MTNKTRDRIKEALASIQQQIESDDDQLVIRSMIRFALILLWQDAIREGAAECREMMARFIEGAGDPVTAMSIRANWNPSWGRDPNHRSAS